MGSCKLLPPQQQSSVKSIWKCGRARFNGSQLKRKVGLVRLGESDSRKSGALLLNLPSSFQYGMGPISTSPPSPFPMYTKTFTNIWTNLANLANLPRDPVISPNSTFAPQKCTPGNIPGLFYFLLRQRKFNYPFDWILLHSPRQLS